MTYQLKVLLLIVAMFLLILLGWAARRRSFLTDETASTLSKFLIDITIPALVFTQMLRTVDLPTLRANWFVPLLGAVVILFGMAIGLLLMPLVKRGDQRSTFAFLVAVANWVYLPLPIAQALYGDDGVRTVLLTNVGSQIVLWSFGVWILRGGRPDWKSLKELATNPGLIATAVGIVLAILLPITNQLAHVDFAAKNALDVLSGHSAGVITAMSIGLAVIQACLLIGTLTIPLSLIVTGAQLGGLDLAEHKPSGTLNGVLIARLLVTPVVFILCVIAAAHFGLHIPDVPRWVTYLIAAMPVAVSCSLFTERYGGDTGLAARTIFYSTLLSIVTLPLLLFIVQRWHL